MADSPVHSNPNPDDSQDVDIRAIEDEMDRTFAETRSREPEFLGLTEGEAAALADALGIDLRLILRDRTPLTVDFRPGRMTLDLRTGTVTSAQAG